MRGFLRRTVTIAWVAWLGILRKKDVYVLLILGAALLGVLLTMNVFGLGGVTAYVKDAGLLLAWLFSWWMAIYASAQALPEEETRGTIFSLLAKPVGRLDLILGKWLGCWTAVTFATLLFYLLTLGVALARGGTVRWAVAGQGLYLHAWALAILSAGAVLCSTRMNHDAAVALAGIVSAAAFLVVPRVPEFAVQTGGWRLTMLLLLYHAMPHFEVFDLRRRIVHDYPPVEAGLLGSITLYGAAYAGCLLALAWLAYHRKRFSRERLY